MTIHDPSLRLALKTLKLAIQLRGLLDGAIQHAGATAYTSPDMACFSDWRRRSSS
jgi:hypothetical protein